MSVPLSEPAALRARLRRVRRRDEGHRHAGGQGLVRDKPLELVERPVVPVQPRIGCRRPPLPGPRPDPGEVFEPDSGPIPDGQGDNLFAETVVDMSDSLFSRAARALRFPFFWRERRARTCCWRRALIRPVLKNTTGPSGGDGNGGDVLSPVNADPPPRPFRAWNLHGRRKTGVPDPFAGAVQLERALGGPSVPNGLKPFGVRSAVDGQGASFPGPPARPNDQAPGVSDQNQAQFWLFVSRGMRLNIRAFLCPRTLRIVWLTKDELRGDVEKSWEVSRRLSFSPKVRISFARRQFSSDRRRNSSAFTLFKFRNGIFRVFVRGRVFIECVITQSTPSTSGRRSFTAFFR